MKLIYNYNITTSLTATLTSDFCYLNAHRYALFGEVISEYNAYWHQGKVPDYMFNGKEMDSESGMYYYSARYYNPPTFISRDPLFEKYPMLSPYIYAMNNPLRFIDPTGMDVEDPLSGKENPPPSNGNVEIQVTKQDNLPKQELHLDQAQGETRQEGRGGIKFTNKDNTRTTSAPSTNSDIESREVGTLSTLFGSLINLWADFLGGNNKSEPKEDKTNTPSTESPTSTPNGTKGIIYSKSPNRNPWGGSKESSYNGTADSILIRRKEEKSGNTIITIKVTGSANDK